ncbi:MAG: hypothetical protein KY412_01800 [Actinobacteria bacterium]|nr:hypothetical protein [Actinomycetota bacterium]
MTTRSPAVVAAVLAAAMVGCAGAEAAVPECEPGRRLAILAQSVPTASLVPCLESMPAGWSFAALDVDSQRSRFWLDSDRAGLRAAEIELSPTCDVSDGTQGEPEEEGTDRYQRLSSLSPRFAGSTYDVFDGGCVIYRYDFASGPHITLYQELHDAVTLFPREDLEPLTTGLDRLPAS